MAAYPEAKLIHTQRDAEAWYESCVETIFWACKPSPARVLNLMVRLPFSKEVRGRFPVLKFDGMLMDHEFGKDLKDKKKVIASYNLHNEEVFRSVPPEKLLVFNVKDGWEPLCRFLNVSVPNEPFPKSNTRAEFMEKVKMISNGSPLE
jgi:hypothetical protein